MSQLLRVDVPDLQRRFDQTINHYAQETAALTDPKKEWLDQPLPSQPPAAWWLRGVVGLGKSLLEVDFVSGEVRRMRMSSCIKCRHLAGNPLRQFHQVTCSIGGEIVWNKTNAQQENCPEGKW